MRVAPFLFAYYLLLVGCSRDSNKINVASPNNKSVSLVSVQHLPNRTISGSNFIESVNLLPLETNKNCLLSDIQKIIQIHDTLVVLAGLGNAGVFAFKSSDGSFLHAFGRKGRGPGEYKTVLDVSYHQNSGGISILDEAGKVILFNLKGEFIKEFKIPSYPSNLVSFPNGDILIAFNQRKATLDDPKMRLVYQDKDMKEIFRSFPYIPNQPFSTRNFSFTAIQKGFFYLQDLCDTVYRIDSTGIKAKYYIDFGKFKLDQSIFKKFDIHDDFAVREYLEQIRSSKKCYQVQEFHETDNGIMFLYSYSGYSYLAIGNELNGVIGGKNLLFDSNLMILPTLVGSTGRDFIFYLPADFLINRCAEFQFLKNQYAQLLSTINLNRVCP